MDIIQSLIAADKYTIKSPFTMTPKGICIHNTANNASAKNEIAYMKSSPQQVSFHIAVDDKEAIQAIPFNRTAWHAGDGANGDGNRNYISIEICYSSAGGTQFDKAEVNAAKVTAKLLKIYGWGIDKVKKHQDFSGKVCPHRTIAKGWQRFLDMVDAELKALNVKEGSDMKKIVTFYGDADLFAAIMVAQKHRCPLMKVADYVVSGIKADEVIQIGGKKEDTNRFVTFKNAAKLV